MRSAHVRPNSRLSPDGGSEPSNLASIRLADATGTSRKHHHSMLAGRLLEAIGEPKNQRYFGAGVARGVEEWVSPWPDTMLTMRPRRRATMLGSTADERSSGLRRLTSTLYATSRRFCFPNRSNDPFTPSIRVQPEHPPCPGRSRGECHSGSVSTDGSTAPCSKPGCHPRRILEKC